MGVTLTVTAGPHRGREFVFDRHDTFLAGRATDAHLSLSYEDPYFSRRHFLLEVNPPLVRVTDLNSRHGITVNGQKVRSADLKDGDEIRAGHTVFRLSVPPPDPDMQRTLDFPKDDEPQRPLDFPRVPVPGVPAPQIADLEIPGYTLQSEIGRGNMGAVYRAVRTGTGEAVAVKVITPVAGTTQKDVRRFLREACIMSQLQHRCIVRYFENGECDGGELWLAMERVGGPDLGAYVADRGPLTVKTAVRLMLHAISGLAHAHDEGFVHRDVKPANLLLDGPRDARRVKVADFGLARVFDDCNLSGLTMADQWCGTPGFMPPEQLTHYRDVKPTADQYSAAATLYFLLCGEFVLNFGASARERMVQIATEPRVPLRKRRGDVPADLDAVIMKALSLDPADRYTDMAGFKGAIRPYA